MKIYDILTITQKQHERNPIPNSQLLTMCSKFLCEEITELGKTLGYNTKEDLVDYELIRGKFLNRWLDPNQRSHKTSLYIAKSSERILGITEVDTYKMPSIGDVLVSFWRWSLVTKEEQRKGIGKDLLDLAIEQSHKAGAQVFFGYIGTNNIASQRLAVTKGLQIATPTERDTSPKRKLTEHGIFIPTYDTGEITMEVHSRRL